MQKETTIMDCPKFEKCPLFNGALLPNDKNVENQYITGYCKAGIEKFEKCKRYIVASELGFCPKFVMPNSTLSVGEIVAKIAGK